MLLQSTQIIPMFTLPTERMLKSQANRAKYFLDSLSLSRPLSAKKSHQSTWSTFTRSSVFLRRASFLCTDCWNISYFRQGLWIKRTHNNMRWRKNFVFYHRYHFSLQVIIPGVSACLRVLIRHVVKIKDKNFFMFFFSKSDLSNMIKEHIFHL